MFTVLILSVGMAMLTAALCSLVQSTLLALSSAQVALITETRPRRGEMLKRFKADPGQPLTALLALNTLALTLGAMVSGAAAIALFGHRSLAWFPLSFTLALLPAQILAQILGAAHPRQIAPYLAAPLRMLILAATPILWLGRAMARLVPGSREPHQISAAELKTIASLNKKSGEIEANQEAVIANIRQLGDKNVRQVMTPRTVTFSVSQALTIRDAARMEDKWRMHSRVPVYDGETDNVVGIVLSQDVLMAAAVGQLTLKLAQIMRPVHFVPETAPLDRIFIDFFEKHQHLFVVVDEYGSVTGVISMEDVLEEIIGREIVDESDKARSMRELAMIRKKKLETV